MAFIDGDGQSSSSRWIRAAEPGVTLLTERTAGGILEKAQGLVQDHEVVIADGPANLAEGTRALLLVADVALIPCGATVPELESTADTVRILQEAQAVRSSRLPAAQVVLSRLRNGRFTLTREAPEAAGMLGVRVCRNVLRLREQIADAPGQRSVVWRMGFRARVAAAEMINVLEEIDTYGQSQTKHIGDVDRRAAGVSGR